MDLGKRIKLQRKNSKLTQSKLAERLFVSESYIALIETGKRLPSTDLLIELSKTFGVTLEYLIFGGKDEDVTPLIREFQAITKDRTAKEISSCLTLVRNFLECVDNSKEEWIERQYYEKVKRRRPRKTGIN